MALINCPECGKEISDSSEKCIHCGYPLKPIMHEKKVKPKKKKEIIIGVIVTAIVIPVILIAFFIENLKKAQICKAEGCNKAVYANGYCIEHYGDVRNGKVVDTYSTSTDGGNKGFAENEETVTMFTKNSKISTDSIEFTLTGYTIASKIEMKIARLIQYPPHHSREYALNVA